jgi:hypothetical protein
MKEFIKNYRRNNLPEGLFILGVILLSVGIFITPQNSWIFGIYFYKSDIQSTLTILKILGVPIIAFSLILNLKKYGGLKNNDTSNFVRLDKIKAKEDTKISVEKTKKLLKMNGGFFILISFLVAIILLIIYKIEGKQEYGTNKLDLSYGSHLKEEDPSSRIYDELDKNNLVNGYDWSKKAVPDYSPEDIKQVKISQNKSRESANLWKSEEVINRYKESTYELSRINEIYKEIDDNYSRIIKIMEEKKKYLSPEDMEFLNSKEPKLKHELERLRDTANIRPEIPTWESEIRGMIFTQDKYSNFFKNDSSPINIKSDYSKFKEISNYMITTDKLIIAKLGSNQQLSEQEIDYSLNERTEKMDEIVEIFNRLNEYIDSKLKS